MTAASLAAPFFTSAGSLLDLDAITATDLNSSNHTRLSNSLPASASAVQPPIRLQPNKPRVLRHQQLLWLGKQRCRFVLRQYDQGLQRAKQPNISHTSPVDTDPSATQAYYGGEDAQATIAYTDDSDDQPQPARHNSAYNDTPDEQQQTVVDALATQQYAQAAGGEGALDNTAMEDGDHAATLPYEVELDLVDDERDKDGNGMRPASQVIQLLGDSSDNTSPIVMSLASSHSSNGNEEDEEDQQPLSALVHSNSNSTDAAGNKKASARTRVKQPSIVATAEEQQSSMEEEEREQRRLAEEEKGRKMRLEADKQKAAFEREVQLKAKQREGKRREEEESERRQEEEKQQRREQEEADRQRQAQQEQSERVKREAKERREAEKREKAKREREQQEEEEEERERKKQERERKMAEDSKRADEERRQAEAAAAVAEEEERQKREKEEAERVVRMKQEDEERQRQLVAAEKQRLQQATASQLGWKSKPSKKTTAQQADNASPSSKKAAKNKTTSPHGKRQSKREEEQKEGAERKEEDTAVKEVEAEEKGDVTVSEQSVDEQKKPEAKVRRGKRKAAEEADDKQPIDKEPKKRASRRKTAEVGRVVPIPITQPAEEQWDAADFSSAGKEQKMDVETEEKQADARMEEERSEVSEVEPENPIVTTAEQTEHSATTGIQDVPAVVEMSNTRGKRKRDDYKHEKAVEGGRHNHVSEAETSPVSTSAHQQQPLAATIGDERKVFTQPSVGQPDSNARAKASARKRGRHSSRQEDAPAAESNAELQTKAAEHGGKEEGLSAPAFAAIDNLSARSSATLAAVDVLEDMDVAQALATESMATTDKEVSPSNATAAPKKRRGRPKKAAGARADKVTMEVEAASEASSEKKRTTGGGKRKLDSSVADEVAVGDEQQGTRYSHRTRSAGAVDDETAAVRTSSSASTPIHATHRTGTKPNKSPHSTVHTRSSSSSSPILLFTAVDHTSYNADIERLQGTITTDPLVATHLVTNKVRRTDKFLIAYSVTPHLQSLQWFERSLQSGLWEDEEAGRLVDKEAETKWDFKLTERRVRSEWMNGWQVWCSDSVVPTRASMKGIVKAAGGRMRDAGVDGKKGREAEKEKVIVIGCEEDEAACMEWTRAGYTVHDKVNKPLACHTRHHSHIRGQSSSVPRPSDCFCCSGGAADGRPEAESGAGPTRPVSTSSSRSKGEHERQKALRQREERHHCSIELSTVLNSSR